MKRSRSPLRQRPVEELSGLRAVDAVSIAVHAGDILCGDRAERRRGKTTLFNMIAGALAPDQGTNHLLRRAYRWPITPDVVCRRGIGRTFQLVRPFSTITVEANVMVGALLRRKDMTAALRRTHEVMRQSYLSTNGLAGSRADIARPQAA